MITRLTKPELKNVTTFLIIIWYMVVTAGRFIKNGSVREFDDVADASDKVFDFVETRLKEIKDIP